jgi:5-methylcytosine-specific restriction endonuclease McrA
VGVEQVIGHIEGIPVGAVFRGRKEVRLAKLHDHNQRGISWVLDRDGLRVGDAIVLHGGYEDDEDEWDTIRYTGASPGKDKDPKTKKLLRSQSWSYRDNAALRRSYDRGHPIRVIRGHKGDRRYSPSTADGYRYDGLYEITSVLTVTSKSPAPDGTEVKICRFVLKRLPDAVQMTALERRALEALEELDEEGHVERFPQSRDVTVRRLIRDTAAAKRIKALHDGKCQLCGLRLVGPDGRPYSQGAHIRPLGKPHHGPDVEPNILCLCPNCHARLDIGAVIVDEDWSVIVRAEIPGVSLLRKLHLVAGHNVHPDYLRYHRDYWRQRAVRAPG